MSFLFPDKYKAADEEFWKADFLDPAYVYHLAQRESEGAWRDSRPTQVRDYILAQMDPL